MNLTQQQRMIVTAPEDKVYVQAPAGSGKTSCIIERAKLYLRTGVDPSSIAIITFTNMAAQEIQTRLEDDYKEGIFIGTIHSLAASFISRNGQGKLIGELASTENFSKFFQICRSYNLHQAYDYILLDESQDTSEDETFFIFEMINPNHYFVVGDNNQHIYGFKGNCYPETVTNYIKRDRAKVYTLTENFRCGESILNFAQSFLKVIGRRDTSISKTGTYGMVQDIPYNDYAIIDNILSFDNYIDWAILTRDNRQLSIIQNLLKKETIPYISFKQSELTFNQLQGLMEQNAVKLLTIHSAKGLGFKNVIVSGTHWWIKQPEEFRIMYVAATRAKERLIWMSAPKAPARSKRR